MSSQLQQLPEGAPLPLQQVEPPLPQDSDSGDLASAASPAAAVGPAVHLVQNKLAVHNTTMTVNQDFNMTQIGQLTQQNVKIVVQVAEQRHETAINRVTAQATAAVAAAHDQVNQANNNAEITRAQAEAALQQARQEQEL